ncbi:sensor histidine kinase NtrY-like [Varunaivibrio sulfuroxidans]|nr:PAS domain-containing sensor histidine kinase [Varunaivibrio sulfuroxidans]WES31157.1 PAS domain-containing sensor histidine kinase [Varunaivibrio sulfuroxidans]
MSPYARLLIRFRIWSRRVKLPRILALVLVVAAVVSGTATFIALTGTSAGENGVDPQTVLVLLGLDGVLLLMLGAVIAWRLVEMWIDRRNKSAGSGLLSRMVFMFSMVAVTPAILVAVFAGLFLNFGIQSWFSDKVRTALEASHSVATAYLHEHRQSIRAVALAVADDLNSEAASLVRSRYQFDAVLSTQAVLRNLPEALVIDSKGAVRARARLSPTQTINIPEDALTRANLGEIVILTSDADDRVRALLRLNQFADAYLLVGRFVDPQVMSYIDASTKAESLYKRLQERSGRIQITFVVIFIVVSLLLLLAAVWIGISFATQLTTPITRLIGAAEKVSAGDLSVRVRAPASTDEVGTLARAFNRMTDRLDVQQQGLIEMNRQLDERRRFTETVLSGVSAGVVGLDARGHVHLPNRSASELLGLDLDPYIGRRLEDAVPEMHTIIERAITNPERGARVEISIVRDGRPRTLIVNVVAEHLEGEVIGYVLTFDDITELLSAQRKAAWADVARRIAHEIKNPLTPIQLSAERLRRKYLKQITNDAETFTLCTDTIVRQVGDIGRMVDEFSDFARMPEPVMKRENISDICRTVFFLERNRKEDLRNGELPDGTSKPDIEYILNLPDDDVYAVCDGRQIAQALTNLLKNAAEAIDGGGERGLAGRITLAVSTERMSARREKASDALDNASLKETVRIIIEDNGVGLAADMIDRLTEPYVTTRQKGTGLGLAIVKKIMEDHDGDLRLENRPSGGARITMIL